MRRHGELRSSATELSQANETQNRLHHTLKLLFELLEAYSPLWYERYHHEQAERALRLPLASTFSIDPERAPERQFPGRKIAA